tara:strand:+ start:17210 stop:18892 length:1683 start_codon:yes stop_codon:yes gene_type:complete
MLKILFLSSLFFLISCTHLKSQRDLQVNLDSEDTEVKELNIVSNRDLDNASKEKLKYNIEEKSIAVEEQEVRIEPIPVEVNVAVERWIDYFTGRGRKHMQRYLGRSSRYLPMMKEILRENALPEDLVYIALIESGFNATAYSRAAAVGYWQFIRGTGKAYGLRIDSYADERRDFVLSTQAAAQYLKALYNLFGDWYLAIASYNVGENRVKRLVMRYQTRDFWELAKRRKLPRETINYVPKYIAAKLIAKNPAKYGFNDVEWQEPVRFDELEVKEPVHLEKYAKALGLSYEEMKRYNPMYRSKLAMPAKGKTANIKVPAGTLDKAQKLVANYIVRDKGLIASMQQPEYVRYRVRRGDTLGHIARRFRTRVSTIKRLNGMRSSFIRSGQRLLVPARDRGGRSYASSSYKRSSASAVGGYHRVRRGENLSLIASRYGTSVSAIKRANGLRSSRIYPGKKLKIPSKNSYHRVRSGENLSLIASRYGVSVGALKAANGLRSSRIMAGKKLRIPGAGRTVMHTVRPGDTLVEIARRYNTSVGNLAKANRLSNKSYIQVGKRLIIPD